ncbi:MAG: RDD family protein [Bacteroidota bacterium]
MENQQVQYAGFWLRFLAFFIDTIIILLLQLILLLPFFGFIGYEMSITGLEDLNKEIIFTLAFGYYVTFMIISWLYFALFHSSSKHATPGKMIVGIRVCHAHKRDLSFSRTSLRYVSKYFSFGILLIGFIIVAFTPRKQALHDFIANTIVIKK